MAEGRQEEKPKMSKVLKGKNWFTITAPKLFNERPLGEALATDPATLVGRVVSASLLELTGDPTRYYLRLFFRVNAFDGAAAKTVYYGHETTRDFLARIVQLRTTRIDNNDVLVLADGKMRIKSVAITNRIVTETVEKAVRARIRELIAVSLKDMTIEQFVEALVKGEIQQAIHAEVNRLYPLRVFEFTKTEIL